MKAICTVAFIVISRQAITLGRDEPGLIKKYVPLMINVLRFLSADEIVNFFFAGNEKIANQIGLLVELCRFCYVPSRDDEENLYMAKVITYLCIPIRQYTEKDGKEKTQY